MAACPLVGVLARAQPVIGIKEEIAVIGPGQEEQQDSSGVGVLLLAQLLPSSFGNSKGKLDLFWGCLEVSLQKKD